MDKKGGNSQAPECKAGIDLARKAQRRCGSRQGNVPVAIIAQQNPGEVLGKAFCLGGGGKGVRIGAHSI